MLSSLWAISLILFKVSSLVGLGLATLKWKNEPTKHSLAVTIEAIKIPKCGDAEENMQEKIHYFLNI
jgi:hypothetical protein